MSSLKLKRYYIGGFVFLLLAAFWVWRGDEAPPAESLLSPEAELLVEPLSELQGSEDSVSPAMPLPEDLEERAEGSPESTFATVRGVVREADTGTPIPHFKLVFLKSPPAGRAQWRGILGSDGPGAGIFKAGALEWHTFTDEQGRFELKSIPGGKPFALAVKAEGYEPAHISVSAIEAGAVQDGEVISLLSVTGIRGRVVNTRGDAVPGAALYRGMTAVGRMIARSDSNGIFRLTEIETGDFALYAEHGDYLPAVLDVSIRQGEMTDIQIVLGDGGSILGTVYVGESPAPNVQVTLHDSEAYTEVIHTDSQGKYRVLGVPPGELEVMAEAPEGASEILWVLKRLAVVSGGMETQVDIQFPSFPSSVSGLITIGGVAATAGVVKAEVISDLGDALTGVRVGGDGRYLVPNVPGGRTWLHVMVADRDGFQRSRKIALELDDGEERIENIDFSGNGTVAYEVVSLPDGGNATLLLLSGKDTVRLGVLERDSGLEERVVVTRTLSSTGSFQLKGVEPGDYILAVVQVGSPEGEPEIGVVKVFSLTVGDKVSPTVMIEF